uniref:NB-ARC domain-containing protein n=1 Tax=Oryza brachyantha TaxID=4533 RepID=J3MR54_ORYBR
MKRPKLDVSTRWNSTYDMLVSGFGLWGEVQFTFTRSVSSCNPCTLTLARDRISPISQQRFLFRRSLVYSAASCLGLFAAGLSCLWANHSYPQKPYCRRSIRSGAPWSNSRKAGELSSNPVAIVEESGNSHRITGFHFCRARNYLLRMAETVVSASKGVIGPLLNKLTKLVEDKSDSLVGMSKNIVFLKDDLPTMNALLEKLEDTDELDPLVKDWRNQVREMAYDIEDCIEDFVHHVGGGNVEAGFIDRVSHFLRTLRARLETAEHIKDLKIRLMEINERRKRYKFNLDSIPSSSSVAVDRLLPAVYCEAANLVGIEGPREQVISWLTDKDQQLMVVSIVGFGVSQRPDITRFLSGIQSKLGIKVSSPCLEVKHIIDSIRVYLQHLSYFLADRHSVASILGSTKEKLLNGPYAIVVGPKFNRYLFVVDDLWDAPTWDIIRCVFPENGMGSRVIVTTRVEDVARWVCCNHRQFIHRMEPLSDENSRRLFFNRIFGSEDGCPSQFREISSQILKKCGGTCGSGTNPTLEGMRQILNLSYKDLPPHLRTCFLYLGIYPEDFTIKRDNLIRQWVAEGFVHDFHGGDSEKLAKSYFNELMNRSLIQPKETKYGEVVSCTVHDMMLDLILRRCAENNFICMAYNLEEMAGQHESKVRRLLLDSRVGESGDAKITGTTAPRLLQLRSLQLFGRSMPNLQRIVLSYVDIEWSGDAPVGIEHLLNLRLRDIHLLPVSDTPVDAKRISLAFAGAVRAHRSRGGADPYLHYMPASKGIPWTTPRAWTIADYKSTINIF